MTTTHYVPRRATRRRRRTSIRAILRAVMPSLVVAIVTGSFQVRSTLIEQSARSATEPSVCVMALRNAVEASNNGMAKDASTMSAINPRELDLQCGTEFEILTSIGR